MNQDNERPKPMAMLPNDQHPGSRCSCRECLNAFSIDASERRRAEREAALLNPFHWNILAAFADARPINVHGEAYGPYCQLRMIGAIRKAGSAGEPIGEISEFGRRLLELRP
jgi:hypothetical protein